MNNNRSYSRYRQIDSFVHKIDPITKLICFLLTSICLFMAQDYYSFAFIFSTIIVISLFARVRLKSYFNLILVVLPFFITMWLIYMLVTWGSAIEQVSIDVLMMTARLYLFFMIAIIFTSSTKELEIARSLEWLIHPLKFIKVPTYEIAMIITLALRFIPIMIDDLFMIIRAQTSRGYNVVNGNLRTKIKGVFQSFLPMFIVSFKRADDLAVAMNVRKYKIGHKRTKYWENKFGIRETISVVVLILMFVGVILIGGM